MKSNQITVNPGKAPSAVKEPDKPQRMKKLGQAATKLARIRFSSGFPLVNPRA